MTGCSGIVMSPYRDARAAANSACRAVLCACVVPGYIPRMSSVLLATYMPYQHGTSSPVSSPGIYPTNAHSVLLAFLAFCYQVI